MESSGSSPEEPRNSAALSRKERMTTRKNSSTNMDNAGQESLAVIPHAKLQEKNSRRSRRSSKRSFNAKKLASSIEEDTSSEEDEKAEVEKKIVVLQKIVPGGESLGVDKLFEETAGYIMELQYQVKALKFLASFVESSDKEKRKFGG
nr:transcription factor PAR1 [Coffea arabica]